MGIRTVVALNGIKTITEALIKQQKNFINRADFEFFSIPADGGLFEAKSGQAWEKHRGIAAKAMRTFVIDKSDRVEHHIMEEAAKLADSFLNYDGQPFDPDIPSSLAVGSIIHRVLFGTRGSSEDPDFVATARILQLFPPVTQRILISEFLPKILRPVFFIFNQKSLQDFQDVPATVDKLVSKNIEQHRNSFDPDNIRDMTDAFLKAANDLSESDKKNFNLSENHILRGTLMQLTGAGLEPVLIQLIWALLYMIAYPDIQAKIQQELDEVVGLGQQPCLNHRGKLPFTEACINEILRHSSISPIPFLYASTTDTTINGYSVHQGTPVIINLYSLTRDERYWQNPDKFDPDRFLDENCKIRSDLLDKFYPFGIGQRRCMGEYLARLEIFIFFTTLMHKCKLEKVPREKLSLEPKPGFFMRPQKYNIIAKSRF
jgi:cytochrome P450